MDELDRMKRGYIDQLSRLEGQLGDRRNEIDRLTHALEMTIATLAALLSPPLPRRTGWGSKRWERRRG